MLWLFAQVWVGLCVALLLGVLAGWLFWARPLRRDAASRPVGTVENPSAPRRAV